MIQHHPEPDILAEYAAGTLKPGAMLVVSCHLQRCAICRQEASLWESAGGALLEDTAAAELSDGALARMMARLDVDAPQKAKTVVPDYLKRFDIPAPLAAQKIGRRRWMTPNIWFAPLGEAQGQARTYLVYARKGTVLAEHTHAGREFTHVLAGAFADGTGVYAQGDFALTDDDLHHAPTVTDDGECLCLVSAEAPMRLTGFAARLVQAATGTLY